MAVGDAEFWVSSGEGDGPFGNSDIRMILITEHPEAMFQRAIDGGATKIFPVGESHGWKVGRLQDPFGFNWEIGHQIKG